MNEIKNENKRVVAPRVNMYLGRNEKGHMFNYPLRSMYISGRTGSGSVAFINNLLINLMEQNSPDVLRINVWEDFCSNVWESAMLVKHRVPMFNSVTVVPSNSLTGEEADKSRVELAKYIHGITSIIDDKVKLDAGEIKSREVYVVCVNVSIDEYEDPRYKEDLEFDINYILRYGEEVGVSLILLCRQGLLSVDTIWNFPYRVSLRNSAEYSDAVIGCNIAYTDNAEKCGVCWVVNERQCVPTKLWYTFRPDTFIHKLIKAFGVKNYSEKSWKKEESDIIGEKEDSKRYTQALGEFMRLSGIKSSISDEALSNLVANKRKQTGPMEEDVCNSMKEILMSI